MWMNVCRNPMSCAVTCARAQQWGSASCTALALLADILGDGQASVLQRKLQFETQEALYASASYSGVSLDTTSFAVYIVPSADVSLEDAEAALDRAIAEFMEEGVDEAQLDRLKTQYRAAGIYAQDNVNGLANAYGRALTSGLTLQDIHEWPDISNLSPPKKSWRPRAMCLI